MALDHQTIDKIIERRRAGQRQIDIAAELNIAQSTVCLHLKQAAREGKLGTKPVMDGFGITQVASKGADGEWIKQRPLGEKFELPTGHQISGVSALVDPAGNEVAKWIKTKAESHAFELNKEAIIAAFEAYRGKVEPVPGPEIFDRDLLTLYPIADLHLGMLAWGRETGANWDLRIARNTLLSSMSQLVACSPHSETAVLLDLGDYTHGDDQTNTTPASGHQLDMDGRFPKIAMEAARLKVELIEMLLQKHAKVVYRGLPGNHDPHVSQMLSIGLALLFEKNVRVRIDDDPSDFWFYQHGLCMFAANHGHRTKPEKLPSVMASYRPEMWGRTKFRRAYSGHVHHTRSGEDMGARWETLRTAASRDAYAHQHGYSAGREMISESYHRLRGLRVRQVVEI